MAGRRPLANVAASVAGVAPFVLVPLAAAYGVVLRVWLLAHLPLEGDEAVVGLMSRAILAGHFGTFYWGQQYGGVEPYMASAVLKVVNGGPMGLNGTAAVLGAVAAALVGLAVARATGSGRLGMLAGALAWVWPYAAVWNSVREAGFRGATLWCGLVMVVCALRIHQRGSHGGRTGWITCALLGLAAGVGWWASPEIGYFVVPVGVVLLASWNRIFSPEGRWAAPGRWGPPAVAVGAAVVGALPWIYTNLGDGFASLRSGSLPTSGGLDYGQRLSVFFHEMLPMQLGLRAVPGGAWAGGPTIGPVLYGLVAAVVVAALVRGLLAVRRGRPSAPPLGAALGVLVFPLLYAAIPASGYWVDGRYGVYLPALLILLLALSLAGPPAMVPTDDAPDPPVLHARHARRPDVRRSDPRHTDPRRPSKGARGRRPAGTAVVLVACAGLIGATVLTVATARAGGVPASPRTFFSGWSDPDTPIRQVAAAMEDHRIRYAYGDYWTAYDLDFLDPDHLSVSPSPADVVRWPTMAAQVAAAPDPAWLFFAPDMTGQATQAFANTEPGPGGYTQTRFEALLAAAHVPYRVVHLGVLDAVIPDRKVRLPEG